MTLLDNFFNYLKLNNSFAENTLIAYKKDISDFILFLTEKNIALDNLTQQDYINFISFLKEQKISKSTAYRKISATKLFAKYLNTNFNTPEFKEKPELNNNLPIVSATLKNKKIDLTEIINYSSMKLREKIIIYLLKESKISVNQITVLETKSFNLITGFLKLNNKIIKLDSEFLIMLKHYLRTIDYSTKYLFPVNFQNNIKPISKQTVWAILRSNLTKNNINLEKLNAVNKTKSIFDIDSKINIDAYKSSHPRENIF